jgi:hypothetical protein
MFLFTLEVKILPHSSTAFLNLWPLQSIVLSTSSEDSKWTFSDRFSTKLLHAFLISPILGKQYGPSYVPIAHYANSARRATHIAKFLFQRVAEACNTGVKEDQAM